ncbi:MAG: DUF2914 domain-containing protein [Nitrosomonas sp.]|nr:DUF2914 domain-containing protein [Nitrosomonas sp.]MCW5607644.1 DUF2914 domain-containing protein [Nitrosomonas sp.]
MSDNKLKIRIHIQQSKIAETNDRDEPDALEDLSHPQSWRVLEKPPFDRRKIAVALTVFSVLVAIMGYMLVGDNETPGIDSFYDDSEKDFVADYSARFNTFGDHRTSAPLPEEQPRLMEKKRADNHDAARSDRHPSTDAAIDTLVPQSKPLRPGSTQTPVPPKPATKPMDSGLEEQLESIPPQIASSAAGIPAGTKKSAADHSGVIRAQLTRQILQREPVDDIDRVLLEHNGSSSIYLFVELSGFGNQQLIVDWYFEDQWITETKLNIGAGKWRTNARKLLNKGDTGAWRVILRDQAGHVLAERRFVVEI